MKIEEYKQLCDNETAHQLIDVRELYEVDICSIGGTHIPMAEILDRASEIRKDVPVIICCRSGKRGAAVTDSLERMGFSNVRNLEGGIMAWIDAYAPTLEKY